MRVYCTLTDVNYLPKMLAMYHSLARHSSAPFSLRVLALDSETEAILTALNLDSMTVTQWKWGPRHKDHSWQEYCWLMASQFCEVLMQTEAEVTYLDADLFFFADPEIVHAEIGDRSIGIIPHRFEGPKIATNGKFNVSWVTFKGQPGYACAARWAHQCRDWCYNRVEPGRFGDQKYLDEFETHHGSEVCVIQNIGAGLAPWNLQSYKLTEGPAVDGIPVVFYHLHEFAENVTLIGCDGPGYKYRLTYYRIRPEDGRLIYAPYIAAYEQAKQQIESVSINA